ncbi:hypothetical protein AAMO2058_001700000 [Amorphochlora amoebiformis]
MMSTSMQRGLGLPARAIFAYYSSMFSASGMLSKENTDLERNDSFFAICGIAMLTTVMAIAVSAKFFLPSYISAAYASCVFLVPLAYRALGRVWVRFCNLLITSRCNAQPTRNLSPTHTGRNGFWRWFICLQLILVLAFWSASMLFGYGYLSEKFSLLVSFGCFNALCVAVLVTHGVGGRLKYSSYRFYQPFQGGTTFCILQAFGWALFALSLFFLLLHFLITASHLLHFCGHCFYQRVGSQSILVGASSTGVVSEILMALSLFVFHGDELPKKTLSGLRRAFSSPSLTKMGSSGTGRLPEKNSKSNFRVKKIGGSASSTLKSVRSMDSIGEEYVEVSTPTVDAAEIKTDARETLSRQFRTPDPTRVPRRKSKGADCWDIFEDVCTLQDITRVLPPKEKRVRNKGMSCWGWGASLISSPEETHILPEDTRVRSKGLDCWGLKTLVSYGGKEARARAPETARVRRRGVECWGWGEEMDVEHHNPNPASKTCQTRPKNKILDLWSPYPSESPLGTPGFGNPDENPQNMSENLGESEILREIPGFVRNTRGKRKVAKGADCWGGWNISEGFEDVPGMFLWDSGSVLKKRGGRRGVDCWGGWGEEVPCDSDTRTQAEAAIRKRSRGLSHHDYLQEVLEADMNPQPARKRVKGFPDYFAGVLG